MPDKEEAKGFYVARKYKFKAKATYLQFLIMFEKIAENQRILNISDLYFKKLEQPQRSKFQLIDGEFNLEAYRYNSAYKEDRGIEEIEKQFKGKAAEAKKDSSKRKSKSKAKIMEKGEE
jgi:Tfp pilus assembly protein PilO